MGRLLGSSSSSGCSSAWWRRASGDTSEMTTTSTARSSRDTALTIVAGPLNYVGLNPKIECRRQHSGTVGVTVTRRRAAVR